MFFFIIFGGNKTNYKCFLPWYRHGITQIRGMRHLDDTSGDPLASKELALTDAESIWCITTVADGFMCVYFRERRCHSVVCFCLVAIVLCCVVLFYFYLTLFP